jgi:hypothetical protein
MLDHHLARTDVQFEQYVELDNLLTDPDRQHISGDEKLATSGLLQFKMLQLLDRILSGPQGDVTIVGADPLKKAWMLAHSTKVAYFEPSGTWSVRAQPYWKVFERNKNASWAEDVAWVASQHVRGTDECYSACILAIHIIEGPLQYWRRFPTGARVADAIQQATKSAEYVAALACYDNVRLGQSPVPHQLVQQVRTSLAKVMHRGKRDILKYLDEAERKCAK